MAARTKDGGQQAQRVRSEPTRWANAKQLSSALQAKLCQSTSSKQRTIEVENELKALEAFAQLKR